MTDAVIRRARLFIVTTYALQAMQCVVGAFVTLVAMSNILDSHPLIGGVLVFLAYRLGTDFCEIAERRVKARKSLRDLLAFWEEEAMRALMIGDAERAACAAATERAAKHPTSLEDGMRRAKAIPQGRPVLSLADRKEPIEPPVVESVELPGGYQCAFSFEHQQIGLCRHLSVAVDTPGRLPHMAAVGMIAEAFGFVAGMERRIWVEEFAPGHHAVNVVEPVMPKATETRQ